MKTIVLDFPFKKGNITPSVIALGCFDGIHLAHEKLINTTIRLANEKGINSAVMTFDPHPKEIIFDRKIDQLMPFKEKQKKLDQLGIDTLYVIRFNKAVSKLPPKLFVQEFLVQLKARHIVVGYDFNYGFKAEGNVNTLLLHGNFTFNLTVISELKKEGEKIGSTQIRKLVKDGLVDQIPSFLGNYYETRVFIRRHKVNSALFEVVPFNDYQVPLQGDYLVKVNIEETNYRGIVSRTSNLNTLILKMDGFIGELPKDLTISWLQQIENEETPSLVVN
ncbi:hypothetical protein ACFSKI_10890 [Pseudogracilibacillus auburnensis]|uniref:FAD synthase n=1 Tax=Pseudogracilibacillus auburnensis TaxID=1494959 RepID=A0A2V3VRU2_9BACI|nr:FAD synthetase family protein [Pseudogracilibacillus auburnensis]PXW83428.1 riboflavin kinase/FMN adenylyltransferase [Pseudogracilibacillus auburnensis]